MNKTYRRHSFMQIDTIVTMSSDAMDEPDDEEYRIRSDAIGKEVRWVVEQLTSWGGIEFVQKEGFLRHISKCGNYALVNKTTGGCSVIKASKVHLHTGDTDDEDGLYS